MIGFQLVAIPVLLATLVVPAGDDVSVTPNPKNASARLEVGKYSPGTASPAPHHGQSVALGRGEVIPLPTVACKVDDLTGVYGCRTYQPADPDVDPRELTEGDILRAVREIGLPRLGVTIEPGAATLVNADTNFYTDPEAFARSIDLLGFDVDLQATPARYTWIHGDGTRHVTVKPGRAYPHLDVTHRYREPAQTVRPRVDVTYRVRYRVDDGAWTTLGQTLTASGPTTDLAVNEAAPVLTAP